MQCFISCFFSAGHIVGYFAGNIILAPVIGYLGARIIVLWLKYTHNSIVVEIMLSLSMSFFVFYISKPTY